MELKRHHKFTLLLIIGILALVFVSDIESTALYDPNSWAGMSIAFGASILTVVGIITSVITSSENDRRADFIDIQNKILGVLQIKERFNQDKSLDKYYKESITKIYDLIEDRAPMKYYESYIGFASFFLLLFSVVFAIYGWPFRFVIGSFLLGIGLIIGYVSYCVEEFWKIDHFYSYPDKIGKLELISAKINGEKKRILEYKTNKEYVILISEQISKMDFYVKFIGKLRNGFLHSVVKYDNGTESHIPDRNTSLLEFGFIDNYQLAVIGGEDTGLLQNNKTIGMYLALGPFLGQGFTQCLG